MKIRNKILFALFILLSFWGTYELYDWYSQKVERVAYIASLNDTSSPTVTVLRDSIFIPYKNEKRTIHLYVPPNYANDTTTRYPVMYFMDGESCFNDLENESPEWQMDEVINHASEKGLQTAIVIGINQSENRNEEYTPFVLDDMPNAHGSAYAKWVTTDLKSWVDTNYRTKPEMESTTIGGISRSGTMAYYMMMAHPNIFGNAVIQSPSMWVDHDRLFAMQLPDDMLTNRKVYVSVGEKEGGPMIPDAKLVYEKFQKLGFDEDHVKFDIIEGEGHWHPTWRKSFALAYPWLIN